MEDINSYIVLSLTGDGSIHFIPNLITGYIPNLYVADASSQKSLSDIEFLVPQNIGDSGDVPSENLMLKAEYLNKELNSESQLNEETVIKCSHCENSFDNYDLYMVHEKTHQNEDQLECTKCNKSFKKVHMYKRHLLTHQDEKNFNCIICNAGFNSENNYKIHMVLHGRSSVCPICNLSFQRMASLKSHLAIHQVEEFHTCPECASEFENKVELRKHIKIHTTQVTNESKLLICNYCKVKFETSSLLKKHVACHMKVKKIVLNGKKMKKDQVLVKEHKHKCKVCGKTFQKLSLLERHLRIHNGERPFVCQVCYKGFTQKGTLQIHLMKHTGVKPFCCTLCPAKFHQKGNLKVHVQKTHTASSEGEKIFKCSECDCIFKKVASLNGHMTKIHSNKSLINITTVIDQLKNLEKQLGGRSTEVEKDEIIENPQNLDSAEQVNDVSSEEKTNENCKVYSLMQKSIGANKVYVCSYCDRETKKPSDMIRHIRTHTKEKPFKCYYCISSFALKSTLLAHMQTHKKRKCGKCSKVIYSAKVWKAHTRKHDSNSTLNSDLKQEGHNNADTYSVSPNTPTKRKKIILDKPLKCPYCSASFLRTINLKRHVCEHNGEKTFKCSICSRLLPTTYALKEHMKNHRKNFSCGVCDKKFINSTSLKRHVPIHEGTKPYECPYCKRGFEDIVMCRKHINTHKESKEVENTPDNCNIFNETTENIHLTNSSDNSSRKTTILRVDTDGVVFDNAFNIEQNNSTVTSTVLQSVQAIDASNISDPVPILESEDQNLQTILVDCQSLPNGEVHNYFLSQLKLQSNDAIAVNAINENEESPIVFNVQNLNVDPSVGNALNDITFTNDFVDKSADPVFSFSEKRLLKQNQGLNSALDTTENCIVNEIGDDFLSNNVSLYPNTQITFGSPPELNSSTINMIDSSQHEFIGVLEKTDPNPECNLLFDVAKETPETIGLSMIHCMLCKKMFDTMESYQIHVCMKSVLKRSDDISPSPERLLETITQTNNTGKADIDKAKDKSKSSVKRLFNCVYCEKEFTSRGHYMKHVNMHQKKGNKLHKCKFCDKEFKKPSDLGRHLRTHTGEKPFACDQCDKKFSLKSTLEGHYRTHNPSATKNFVCEVCNSFFSSKASRTLHMHVHTGVKPQKCNFCDQYFRTAAHRKCHENKMHLSGQKKVRQSKAKKITNLLAAAVDMAVNEATSENQVLEEQENPGYSEIQVEFPEDKYPPESIPIDPVLLQQLQNSNILLQGLDHNVLACTESVNGLETIEASDIISSECFEENVSSISQIVGNFLCEICQEEFGSPDALKEHMDLHLKKLECEQCSLWFSSIEALSEHQQSHLSTESYSCLLCDIVFFGIQELKGHLRSVHQLVETPSQLIL